MPKSIIKKSIIHLFALLCFVGGLIPVEANSLATSQRDLKRGFAVPINKPDNLNFLSQKQVLEKREKCLQKSASLLIDKYEASPTVFGRIEDNKGWWGLQGAFIWGPGPHSIEGPAEESRFILNPFLLVGANSASALIWKKDKINDSDLKNPDFPYCWLPDSLTYYPANSMAQAVYLVSNFNRRLRLYKDKLVFNPNIGRLNRFGLIAYNARDFGYQYIFLDIGRSLNIINAHGCEQPIFIKQLIHCGKSARYPGGCNNMSPAMPEIDHFVVADLPARACVYLWKSKPASNQKADFTFYLDFR